MVEGICQSKNFSISRLRWANFYFSWYYCTSNMFWKLFICYGIGKALAMAQFQVNIIFQRYLFYFLDSAVRAVVSVVLSLLGEETNCSSENHRVSSLHAACKCFISLLNSHCSNQSEARYFLSELLPARVSIVFSCNIFSYTLSSINCCLCLNVYTALMQICQCSLLISLFPHILWWASLLSLYWSSEWFSAKVLYSEKTKQKEGWFGVGFWHRSWYLIRFCDPILGFYIFFFIKLKRILIEFNSFKVFQFFFNKSKRSLLITNGVRRVLWVKGGVNRISW